MDIYAASILGAAFFVRNEGYIISGAVAIDLLSL